MKRHGSEFKDYPSKRQKVCPIVFDLTPKIKKDQKEQKTAYQQDVSHQNVDQQVVHQQVAHQQQVLCQICQTSSSSLDENKDKETAMIYVCDMSHVNCSKCSVRVLLNQICPCAIYESSAADNIWRRGFDPDIWFQTLWKLGTSQEVMNLDMTGLMRSAKSWLKKIAQETKFGSDLFPADYKIPGPEIIDLSNDDEPLQFLGQVLNDQVLNGQVINDQVLNDQVLMAPSQNLEKRLGDKPVGKVMCGMCFNNKECQRENVTQWCAGIKPVDSLLWDSSRARFLGLKAEISIPCVFGGKHSIHLGLGLKDLGNLTFDYVLSVILDHALNHKAAGYCDVIKYCNHCDYQLGIPLEDCQYRGHFALLEHILKEHSL